MSRPEMVSLGILMAGARQKYPIDTHLKHMKSGEIYVVTDHTICESSQIVHLTYRPIKYDNDPKVVGQTHLSTIHFSRPSAEFHEIVDEGAYKGPRFKKVRKDWVVIDEAS